MGGASALVSDLKSMGQDHEFYPTTNEIIEALADDILMGLNARYSKKDTPLYLQDVESVLDIGAGNGKVLLALHQHKDLRIRRMLAIEKSAHLRGQMPASIFVVGTELCEQSLVSRAADVVFSNPPYSVFEAWAVKIIREAAAAVVYLVIPSRWKDSVRIKDALRMRKRSLRVVGSFDFEDSEDRKARAKVDLVCCFLGADTKDAFSSLFDEQFEPFIRKFAKPVSKRDSGDSSSTPLGSKRRRPYHDLPAGENYPAQMVALYNAEMTNLQNNYATVMQLDVDLLEELEVSPDRIKSLLWARLEGLRHEYWREVFSRMTPLTSRLTTASRDKLLRSLSANGCVDFTPGNIHAVMVWAIKNANQFIDSQLVDSYEKFADKANVVLYKSNQRTFVQDGWRYNTADGDNTHYALDYRVVTHRVGGIYKGTYQFENKQQLTISAHEFITDMLTVANNLGFLTRLDVSHLNGTGLDWVSGKPRTFDYTATDGTLRTLFEVKAFANGNLHFRFAPRFILALNVEFGRLKGWLKSGQEAAQELDNPEAAALFNSNALIGNGDGMLMLK